MRYYVETVNFVYRRADGTVAPQPPANAAAGDQLEITELGYKGTHKSHAKKSTRVELHRLPLQVGQGRADVRGLGCERGTS